MEPIGGEPAHLVIEIEHGALPPRWCVVPDTGGAATGTAWVTQSVFLAAKG